VIPTFLDLRTGKTAKGYEASVFWWTEGNGSCDCSRCTVFPDVTDTAWRDGICYGHRRFVAIDVEGSLEDAPSKEHVLRCMNAEYCR
jgi:hypothetical protein